MYKPWTNIRIGPQDRVVHPNLPKIKLEEDFVIEVKQEVSSNLNEEMTMANEQLMETNLTENQHFQDNPNMDNVNKTAVSHFDLQNDTEVAHPLLCPKVSSIFS